ncbi:uncharacterized protein METZ01_LOCUS141651 [marine metagenome]|uniref:Uncharacterized protein n=1 Tax=marine metagenome TaxID=408172 RepID=A0A381ZJ72_9ZZZZ
MLSGIHIKSSQIFDPYENLLHQMNRKTTSQMRLGYLVLQVNQLFKFILISKYFIDILN